MLTEREDGDDDDDDDDDNFSGYCKGGVKASITIVEVEDMAASAAATVAAAADLTGRSIICQVPNGRGACDRMRG